MVLESKQKNLLLNIGFLILTTVVLGIIFSNTVSAATFTVDSTGDETDLSAGNGVCLTSQGTCTLRAAIQETNALVGKDNIYFNIPTSDSGYRDYDSPNTTSSGDSSGGDDYWTIRPASILPTISEVISIDGSTQESNSGNNRNTLGPDIEIKSGGSITYGLRLADGGSNNDYIEALSLGQTNLIQGLTINGFSSYQLDSNSGTLINNNYFCTDVKGLGGISPVGSGVFMDSDYSSLATNNVVGNCSQYGIYFTARYSRVEGNIIGLDRTGADALPMDIALYAPGLFRASIIGGTGVGTGNTLRGDSNCLYISDGTSTESSFIYKVLNNKCGINLSGNASVESNPTGGMYIKVSDTTTPSEVNGNISSRTIEVIGISLVTNNIVGTDSGKTLDFDNGFSSGFKLSGLITNFSNNTAYYNNVGITIVKSGSTAPASLPENFVVKNNYANNNNIGIQVTGFSPYIQGNVIQDNAQWGVKVIPVQSTRTTNSANYTARPKIGGTASLSGSLCSGLEKNCITNNGYGGIYMLDTVAFNDNTVYTDNTFSNNNNRNVEQAWYGLFEVFSNNYRRTDISNLSIPVPSQTRIRETDDPSILLSVITTSNTVSCLTVTTDCPSTGHTTGTLNKSNISVSNGSGSGMLSSLNNWLRVTEYVYDSTGSKTTYGTFQFDSDHFASKQFSFDGNSTTDPSNGYTSRTISSQTYTDRGEPWTNNVSADRNISTGAFGRFQIMEVEYVDANPVLQGDGSYIITVDSTEDLANGGGINYFNDGSGSATGGLAKLSTSVPINGKTSLREALLVAGTKTTPDKVHFNIPTTDSGYRDYDTPDTPSSGDGVGGDDYWTIRVGVGHNNSLSFSYNITNTIEIDATTQTTNKGNTNNAGPEIELSGKDATMLATQVSNLYGLSASSGATAYDKGIIKGFAINSFNTQIEANSGLTIQDNYLCTDVRGETINIPTHDFGDDNGPVPLYNKNGAYLTSYNIKFKDNLIHSCDRGALWNPDYGVLTGNIFGLDQTGSISKPLRIGLESNEVERESIAGGTSVDDRNLFRADEFCVNLQGGAFGGSSFINNYCGLNAAGNTKIASGGISISDFTEIKDNISTASMEVGAATVTGNIVGTDASKTLDLGDNTIIGMEVFSGSTTIQNNTIYNMKYGITGSTFDYLGSPYYTSIGANISSNDLRNNEVGLREVWVNSANPPTQIEYTFSNNHIENNAVGIEINGYQSLRTYNVTNNVLTNNDLSIKISGQSKAKLVTNQIAQTNQSSIPINLVGGTEDIYGSTVNDSEDPDSGSNNLMNSPSITSVTYLGSGVYKVEGNLDNKVNGEAPFTIEICESSVNSEHGRCINSVGTATGLSNNWSVQFTISGDTESSSKVFSALATNALGSTSEFSKNFYSVPLVFPTNNASISALPIHFDWEATLDTTVTKYKFYLDDALITTITAPSTGLTYNNSLANGNHTWRVEAVRADDSIAGVGYSIFNIPVPEVASVPNVPITTVDPAPVVPITNTPVEETPVSYMTNQPTYTELPIVGRIDNESAQKVIFLFPALAIITTAASAALTTISVVSAPIATLSPLLALNALAAFTPAFLRRRKKYWGIILDDSTNLPIPFAVVRLYDANHNFIAETVSDLKGKYSVSVENKTNYQIPFILEVSASGYQTMVKESFTANLDLIVKDISLVRSEGNASSLRSVSLYQRPTFYSYAGIIILILAISGLIYGIYAISFAPSIENVLLITFYSGIVLLNLGEQLRKAFAKKGRVLDISTKGLVSGAIVRVYDQNAKQVAIGLSKEGVVKFDLEQGNYFIRVDRRGYESIINKPITISSNGFVKENIELNKA